MDSNSVSTRENFFEDEKGRENSTVGDPSGVEAFHTFFHEQYFTENIYTIKNEKNTRSLILIMPCKGMGI